MMAKVYFLVYIWPASQFFLHNLSLLKKKKEEEEEEAETSEVFPVCLYLAVLLFHVAEGKWFLQCGPERDR